MIEESTGAQLPTPPDLEKDPEAYLKWAESAEGRDYFWRLNQEMTKLRHEGAAPAVVQVPNTPTQAAQ